MLSLSFTPKNWEVGLGFASPCSVFDDWGFSETKYPAELYLMLGPVTVSLLFGRITTID